VARDVKDNKKGFCKYIGDRTKARKNVGLLLNEMEEALFHCFASAFTSKIGLQESQVPKTGGKAGARKTHWVEKGSHRGILEQTRHT